MSRPSSLRNELGRTAVVYIDGGEDLVSGVLVEVTSDDVILEVVDPQDAFIGVRHIIPWVNISRIMTVDMSPEAFIESLTASAEEPIEPPEWISEVLMEIAQEEAAKNNGKE